MRIIAINGSPDPEGNTALLLDRVLRTARSLGAETERIEAIERVSATKGSPFCTVCGNPCTGVCYQGSALEAAYERMGGADALVIGSPVYFGTVSAPLKAFFDKTRRLRTQRRLCNVVGAGVTVAASPYGGQETTLRALHDMMLVHGMILVGDGHPDEDCGHHGVCARRPAGEDSAALARADILARRLVAVSEATAGLRRS